MDWLQQDFIHDALAFLMVASDLINIAVRDGHSHPDKGPGPPKGCNKSVDTSFDLLKGTRNPSDRVVRAEGRPIKTYGDTWDTGTELLIRTRFEQQAVCAAIDRHAIPGKAFQDWKNVLSQKRFPSRNTDYV